jgi:rod shape-determining protein MreB
VREAIEEPVQQIVDSIKFCLDKTPPELAADMMDRGVVLTGGGALLQGLDVRIANDCTTPVVTADRPLHSVVIGSGLCLEEFDALQEVLTSSGRI